MTAGNAYGQISALLREYMRPLGMLVERGPLRAMRELTQGIVFTHSVQLTNAARLVADTTSQLHRMEERLSAQLADPAWDHRDWAQRILQEQVRPLDEDSLIPIDSTDLAKPYARRMQYLATVQDASRVGDPLVNGYWCWGAYHWEAERQTLSALQLLPYSTRQPGFRSENDQWIKYLHGLRQATGGKGIWLHDRGADRPEILSTFMLLQPRWIIRLREDRALIGPDDTIRSAGQWADFALQTRLERGRAITLPVRLVPQDIRLPPQPPPLWLLVPTYRFGNNERWVLLTCGLIDHHQGPRQIRHEYAWRWRSEDAKRFLNQIWHVERFMTRPFLALERMLGCVSLASGFLALLQRESPQLLLELESEVLYLRKKHKIPAYRIARGMQSVAVQNGQVAMAVNA